MLYSSSTPVLAILHKARKQAGRTNWPIYGIATDSWDWHFLRLDPNGVVRNLVYGVSIAC